MITKGYMFAWANDANGERSCDPSSFSTSVDRVREYIAEWAGCGFGRYSFIVPVTIETGEAVEAYRDNAVHEPLKLEQRRDSRHPLFEHLTGDRG